MALMMPSHFVVFEQLPDLRVQQARKLPGSIRFSSRSPRLSNPGEGMAVSRREMCQPYHADVREERLCLG